MAISLKEFIEKLKELEKEVEQEIPKILDVVALDGIALLEIRLRSKGIEGAEYSPAYREFKLHKQGAEAVRVVNLSLSNRMLTNLDVIDRSISGTAFHSGIGNTTTEEINKMEANIKRYGDEFLNMTKEEQIKLNATAQDLFDKIIKKHFP